MRYILSSLIFVLLLIAPEVSAHPGNTAADGCHYCRTNCDKWGVAWNERHCHGGSSVPVEQPKTIQRVATPVSTKAPPRVPTEVPPIVVPTVVPTVTPSSTPTLTPTNTIVVDQTQDVEEVAMTEHTVQPRKGFFSWLFSVLFGN